jgi:hypothetical protein
MCVQFFAYDVYYGSDEMLPWYRVNGSRHTAHGSGFKKDTIIGLTPYAMSPLIFRNTQPATRNLSVQSVQSEIPNPKSQIERHPTRNP